MKAAIYARKSTDDNSKNKDNKSVTRQVERAKAYATKKGWTVDDAFVFVDDGISGADFKKRTGLIQLLNNLKGVDAIIMSELSRLGRDQIETSRVLSEIEAKDKRVFFYLTDEELRFESAIDRFTVNAMNFSAEIEREKASQRSRDALERKAQKGYNTGGRVYGYDNVSIMAKNGHGEEVKSHTEYRINKAQAKIINAIFRLYADGHGLTAIAKTLNGDPKYKAEARKYFGNKLPTPPAAQTKKCTGSWSHNTIRDMLRNVRYSGKVPWGQHRKAYKQGAQKRIKQGSRLLIPMPHLRIVPEELWATVQSKIRTNSRKFGGGARESTYMLSGTMKCTCGGSMVVTSLPTGPRGKHRLVKHYQCSYHHKRGSTVCDNSLRPKMDEIDGQVIEGIKDQVLSLAAIRFIAKEAMKIIKQAQKPSSKKKLQQERKQIEQELDNFMALVAGGSTSSRVLSEIEKREARLVEIERELAAQTPVGQLDEKRMEKALRTRAADLAGLLRSDTRKARRALDKLLDGPIEFIPGSGKGYTIRGNTRLGALLPPASTLVASPRGFEPLLSP
jgi:site-specific DNA recombinase